MTIAATLSLTAAGADAWDVIVVGAGPAGAIAARELAAAGVRVLLVDKRSFPRAKVCGACLSPHALGVLKHVGLTALPTQLGGEPYNQLRLWSRGVAATLSLPDGIALTRFTLDEALLEQAIAVGVQFLPGTQADLGDASSGERIVRLKQLDRQQTAAAKIVVAADGLGGSLLCQAPEITYRVWKHSRIGVGATWQTGDDGYRRGSIYMAVGRHGYVGLVRAEDNLLNVGAALDVKFIRRYGEIAGAITATIEESGLPRVDAEQVKWQGTPPLTRVASRVGGQRLFAIGDAASYAEPFTGEGMAWAMTSAVLVVPHVRQALRAWQSSLAVDWDRAYQRAIRSRQKDCRRLAMVLRRPWLVRNTIAALKHYPLLARPLVRRISSVPQEILS